MKQPAVSIKHLLTSLALLLPLAGLPGCAARQDMPEGSVSIQDQQTHLEAFLTNLFAKNGDLVLAETHFPFYYNHRAVLNYPEEWLRSLQEFSLKNKDMVVSHITLTQFTAKQLETEKPKLWAQLMQYGFDNKLYWLAQVQLQIEGKPARYQALMLLDPRSGKVTGYVE